jgi:hypothetical protein
MLTRLKASVHRAARGLRRLCAATNSGIASIEFALLAPVMASMMCGMVDLTDAIIANQRVSTTAEEVGEIATQQSVQPDLTTSLTVAQVLTAQTAIYGILPEVRYLPSSSFSVTISEISYNGYSYPPSSVPCTPASPVQQSCYPCNVLGLGASGNCPYNYYNVAWSIPLTYGGQVERPCGSATIVLPTASPTVNASGAITSVPTGSMTTGNASVLAVDVSYKFTPIFFKFVTGTITFRQSAYFNQRSFTSPYVTLTTTGATAGTYELCSGYT